MNVNKKYFNQEQSRSSNSNQKQKNDKHTLPSQENVMFSQMVLLQLNIFFVWLAEKPSLQKYWTVSLLKS